MERQRRIQDKISMTLANADKCTQDGIFVDYGKVNAEIGYIKGKLTLAQADVIITELDEFKLDKTYFTLQELLEKEKYIDAFNLIKT